MIAAAKRVDLKVHTYTLRAEAAFLSCDHDGAVIAMEDEIGRLLDAGVDGYFTDQPDRGLVRPRSP